MDVRLSVCLSVSKVFLILVPCPRDRATCRFPAMRFLLLLVAVLLACLWGGDSAKRGRKQLKVKPTQSGDGSWYRVVVQEDEVI